MAEWFKWSSFRRVERPDEAEHDDRADNHTGRRVVYQLNRQGTAAPWRTPQCGAPRLGPSRLGREASSVEVPRWRRPPSIDLAASSQPKLRTIRIPCGEECQQDDRPHGELCEDVHDTPPGASLDPAQAISDSGNGTTESTSWQRHREASARLAPHRLVCAEMHASLRWSSRRVVWARPSGLRRFGRARHELASQRPRRAPGRPGATAVPPQRAHAPHQ